MFCTECGARLEDASAFCVQCGTRRPVEESSADAGRVPTARGAKVPPTKPLRVVSKVNMDQPRLTAPRVAPRSDPVAEKKQANAVVLSSFLEQASGAIKDKKFYFHPKIPPSLLSNALESFGNGVQAESVLVLVDSTLFGSAKDGLMVTYEAIHAKDLGLKPVIKPIDEIGKIEVNGNILVKLKVNGEDFFDGSGLSKKPLVVLANCLSTALKGIVN